MLLRLEGVEKRFGDRVLFSGVDLDLRPGDRIGLIGPNGAGKTTLLRLAAGLEAPDAGRRILSRGVRVAMLRQEIDPTLQRSVRDEAASALRGLDRLEAEIRELEQRMAELGHSGRELPASLEARYDQARRRFEQSGGFGRGARVERVLAGLGFGEAERGQPLCSLSGGRIMRVELAKLLLAEPEVLLLDEPTNHLDLPSIQWFEQTLERFRGALVVVSHDRTFLRRHARGIAALERGRFHLSVGGYDRYVEARSARRDQLLARKRTLDRQIRESERFIERFRAKASKARQVQSRIRSLEKLERVQVEPEKRRRLRLRIPEPERAGAVVLRLDGVHKSYAEKSVYRGVDLELRRGDRVALVGPNGAGKSTLLRIVAGVLPFESGQRRPGHNVQCAFFAQHQLEALRAESTVLEELSGMARTTEIPRLRSHLGAFLFSGDDVEKQVSVLSGGEKSRLALAKLLFRPANLLVLDESTNHLDLEAREVLEEALGGYTGTLVFISHDRSFINALASRVVEVRAGQLREFPGNYDDYLRATSAEPEPTSAPAPAGEGDRAEDTSPGKTARQARQRQRERRKQALRLERRIERLEGSILERERGVEALGWQLGDPAVHRDGDAVRSLEAEREAVREEIRRLYREWEALAAELEALGDGTPDASEA